MNEREPSSDPPRRIAFVITRSDVIGGAQLHVFELAKALHALGHQVTVMTGEGPFVDKLRAVGVPVWPVPELIRAIDPITDARAIAKLYTALLAFNPDLISTHSTKAGWLARAVGKTLGVPVLVTAHGWLLEQGRLAAWQRVAKLAEQTTAPLADVILCVSNYDRELALRHRIAPAAKLRVVHNALPEADAPQADPGRSPPKLVMVARFEEPKDPLTAIAALARLRALEWTCELIGDGPMRPQVERAIAEQGLADRIVLAGTRDDVPQRLAEAQVFMLITRREGFPISILEAMRAGLPVVASAVGGIAEAVVEGETGALVEAGDPAALAGALEPLLRDAGLRTKLGQAGRRRFVAEFEFATHLRRIWAIYAELCERAWLRD
ncbi:glycosyltransferase family 4 protein [Nannocystaceae bacterium ST9]